MLVSPSRGGPVQQAGEGSVGAEQQVTPLVWAATAESVLAKVARGPVDWKPQLKPRRSTRYQDRQAPGSSAGAAWGRSRSATAIVATFESPVSASWQNQLSQLWPMAARSRGCGGASRTATRACRRPCRPHGPRCAHWHGRWTWLRIAGPRCCCRPRPTTHQAGT